MWNFTLCLWGSWGLLNPDVYCPLGLACWGIVSLSKPPVPLGEGHAQEWCWVQGEHALGLWSFSGAALGGTGSIPLWPLAAGPRWPHLAFHRDPNPGPQRLGAGCSVVKAPGHPVLYAPGGLTGGGPSSLSCVAWGTMGGEMGPSFFSGASLSVPSIGILSFLTEPHSLPQLFVCRLLLIGCFCLGRAEWDSWSLILLRSVILIWFIILAGVEEGRERVIPETSPSSSLCALTTKTMRPHAGSAVKVHGSCHQTLDNTCCFWNILHMLQCNMARRTLHVEV